MSSNQPVVIAAGPRQRRFATSAVAMQAIIINEAEEILLLSSPKRKQGWQLVSGALEANETLLGGVSREVREEVGENIDVRPLGTVHVETFHYDDRIQFALTVNYLFAYQGGEIIPGDDMIGSDVRWWSLADLYNSSANFHATVKLWMLERAVELYRLWRDQPEVPLQRNLVL